MKRYVFSIAVVLFGFTTIIYGAAPAAAISIAVRQMCDDLLSLQKRVKGLEESQLEAAKLLLMVKRDTNRCKQQIQSIEHGLEAATEQMSAKLIRHEKELANIKKQLAKHKHNTNLVAQHRSKLTLQLTMKTEADGPNASVSSAATASSFDTCAQSQSHQTQVDECSASTLENSPLENAPITAIHLQRSKSK
jgi:transcriptional regulator NrdR family protein